MASVHLPKVFTQRGMTQVQIDRDNFEKIQNTSVAKALCEAEVPVKEKHARIIVIGTHKDKGAIFFWHAVRQQPLQGHPIVCWKFCSVLHKVLRDGHPSAVTDSHRYSGFLVEHGKLWGHLREGYGNLIAFYTKLLVGKLAFLKKNPEIPGNYVLKDNQLEQICGNDINRCFELSVDMLDCLDDILALQTRVYGSLDMSRSNSMTSSGQCRLLPLIQCIQDSCQLYDYIVKLLFKLHSSLPPDTLSGHRDRFYIQFKSLKQFYYSSSNLQYFKNLIQIPLLPDNPPNFLRGSDLSNHVRPVAIVPDQLQIPENAATMDLLVDTSSTASSQDDQLRLEETFGQNEAVSPSVEERMQQEAAAAAAVAREAAARREAAQRDRLVAELRAEIARLRRQLADQAAEDQMMVESLQNRLRELEMELSEIRQIAESTTHDNEALRTVLKEGENNQESTEKLYVMEKLAQSSEDKFKKMKDIYGKLRQEHLTLLRTHAEMNKELKQESMAKDRIEEEKRTLADEVTGLREDKYKVEVCLQQGADDMAAQRAAVTARQTEQNKSKQGLEAELAAVMSARAGLESSLAQSRSSLAALQQQMEQSGADRDSEQQLLRRQMDEQRSQLLESALSEGQGMLRAAVQQADNTAHATVMCTSEYLIDRTQPVLDSLDRLGSVTGEYSKDKQEVGPVIKAICDFSHRLSDVVVLGYGMAHSADIEVGEEMTRRSRASGDLGIRLLELIREGRLEELSAESEALRSLLRLLSAQSVQPDREDLEMEQIGSLVDAEMEQTSKAIEQAAAKIAEMLAKSREAHTGIQLEVNERILDSCNNLMLKIKVLVEKSKSLQTEIIDQGRGTVSTNEFYKKHHRWTEGLISAAKAVGWGANVLLEAADKVVAGTGKFEALAVCSQEIAASTAQLVVSSKVKADRHSERLAQLAAASRGVTTATGNVVASAKSCAQLVEDRDTMDFSRLTLHQAKRGEMESQVRVLELESDLEKERVKLAGLRRTHYALAGEAEGWDQEDVESVA